MNGPRAQGGLFDAPADAIPVRALPDVRWIRYHGESGVWVEHAEPGAVTEAGRAVYSEPGINIRVMYHRPHDRYDVSGRAQHPAVARVDQHLVSIARGARCATYEQARAEGMRIIEDLRAWRALSLREAVWPRVLALSREIGRMRHQATLPARRPYLYGTREARRRILALIEAVEAAP